jgi:hypothetical protein
MGSFTPRSLYLQESTPGTHCIGGWVDPRTGLDDMVKKKILPLPGLEIQQPGLQPVASHYIDSGTEVFYMYQDVPVRFNIGLQRWILHIKTYMRFSLHIENNYLVTCCIFVGAENNWEMKLQG